MPQKDYRIFWEIDVYADSPVEAAQLALASIIDGDARVFEVYEHTRRGEYTPVETVDLAEIEENLPIPKPRLF